MQVRLNFNRCHLRGSLRIAIILMTTRDLAVLMASQCIKAIRLLVIPWVQA